MRASRGISVYKVHKVCKVERKKEQGIGVFVHRVPCTVYPDISLRTLRQFDRLVSTSSTHRTATLCVTLRENFKSQETVCSILMKIIDIYSKNRTFALWKQ
jgi:hypothetical protein